MFSPPKPYLSLGFPHRRSLQFHFGVKNQSKRERQSRKQLLQSQPRLGLALRDPGRAGLTSGGRPLLPLAPEAWQGRGPSRALRGRRQATDRGGVLACRCLGDGQSDRFPGESQPHRGVAPGEKPLPFKPLSFRTRAELGLCWPGKDILASPNQLSQNSSTLPEGKS